VRLLPSAKVCFLGGCPQSGRNQNLYRRNSEAEDRCAAGRSLCSLAVLESDGRKREVAKDNAVMGVWNAEAKPQAVAFALAQSGTL
jgi:hypothetical protein